MGKVLRDAGKGEHEKESAGCGWPGPGTARHGRDPGDHGNRYLRISQNRAPPVGAGTSQDTIYGVYGGLARKSLNAMSAVEREDYLRAIEFASPAFIEAVLK